MATNKVEIGFDLSGNPDAEFARLDDAFYGILDAPQTILGGAIYQDVTPKVVSYSLGRGKSRQLDKYQAGKLNVQLNNNDRLFDPLYAASPYRGQIIPKRAVRVTSNDVIQYEGLIDDWDLSYSPNGNSFASIVASDAFSQFANQNLRGGTATAQFTGERVAAILQNAGVQWPNTRTQLETGLQFLQGEVIADGAGALQYLQNITDAEPGSLFVSKTGDVVFRDRQAASAGTPILFADDNTGIPYQSLSVVFGAENLFNQVEVGRLGGTVVTEDNFGSQTQFGIQTLSRNNLPLDTDESAADLAKYLVAQFAEPEYRFESIEIDLTDLSQEDQTRILDLELGDFVEVRFTPNNVPPAIDRFAEVIRIAQNVNPTSHRVTLGLATTEYYFWRLSDLVFGRLSIGNALGY
jgi:hypothetical protein